MGRASAYPPPALAAAALAVITTWLALPPASHAAAPAVAAGQGTAAGAPAATAPDGPMPVLSSHGVAVATPANGGAGPAKAGAAAAPGLAFDLPAGWVSEKPGSSMRIAQAVIPGVNGGPPGQFAIFHFGPGGGGSTADNIQRWSEQIDAPVAPPHREELTTHGLKVTWVEAAGTLKAATVGMGPAQPQPGSRLLGAVVEGPGGPWYIKAIGPDAALAAARGAFLKLLAGLRPR